MKEYKFPNIITEFKKGDKVKIVEEKVKSRFGRNHGLDCDEVLEFVEVYGQRTGHFKSPSMGIITLQATDVEKI